MQLNTYLPGHSKGGGILSMNVNVQKLIGIKKML